MPTKVKSLRALAKALKLSPAAIKKHASEPGFPPADRAGLYSVPATRAFLESRRELDKAAPGGSYKQSVERKAAAQARREELKLAVEEGALVNAETVEMQQRQFVQVVQSDLLNAHTTLAMLVTGKTGAELENEIKGFMRRMIESWKKLAKKKEDERAG